MAEISWPLHAELKPKVRVRAEPRVRVRVMTEPRVRVRVRVESRSFFSSHHTLNLHQSSYKNISHLS